MRKMWWPRGFDVGRRSSLVASDGMHTLAGLGANLKHTQKESGGSSRRESSQSRCKGAVMTISRSQSDRLQTKRKEKKI